MSRDLAQPTSDSFKLLNGLSSTLIVGELAARDQTARANGWRLSRRPVGLQPSRRTPAAHCRDRLVNQEILEHRAAEGPADERSRHGLSQSPASPAQIKARKNLDTTLTAAMAWDPADRCEGRIHGRLRSTTGDGNASNLRNQMAKDTLSRMATASSAARRNHTKRESDRATVRIHS